MEQLIVNGVAYNATPAEAAAAQQSEELAGNVEKMQINGQVYDIRDVEDVEALDRAKLTVTQVEWGDNKYLSNFLVGGTYHIRGTRTNVNDDLPMGEAGDNATIDAQLLVLESSIKSDDGSANRECITQVLTLSNRLAGSGDVYVRTGIGRNKGGVTFGAWRQLGAGGGSAAIEAQAPLSQENGKLSLRVGDGLKVEGEKLVLDDFVREGAVVEYDEENKRLEFKGLSDTSTAINSAKSLALRELFVAAGAEYNDTGSAIEKDTPWGEKILHLPGCYHFNHIGDLTGEDMAYIIANQSIVYHLNIPRLRQKDTKLRTFIPLFHNQGVESLPSIAHSTFSLCDNLEVVKFTTRVVLENIDPERYRTGGSYMFFNCNKLKYVQPLRMTATTTILGMFEGCKSLIEVEIYNLAGSISFSDSNLINKKTILCAIQNATPASAITITLHPNAYARLVDDVDIIAALRAKPLVTLVSA